MSYLVRLGGCALFVAALAGCACLCACWVSGGGALASMDALLLAMEEGERLSALTDAAAERNAVKEAAGGELAEGRLGLPAALRRLREHWHEWELRPVPGRSDDERQGWSLICWAASRRHAAAPPGHREWLGRLEEELRAHLRAEGLPEPDPEGRAWVLAHAAPGRDTHPAASDARPACSLPQASALRPTSSHASSTVK